MSEIEKEYRWRKKKGTGNHYFKYQGKRHKVGSGDVVNCPLRLVNPCIDQYTCLGLVGDDGNVTPIDINTIESDEQSQEEDIKLEVVMLGRGWFDVINPENPDKPINDKALRRDEAYKLAGINDDLERGEQEQEKPDSNE